MTLLEHTTGSASATSSRTPHRHASCLTARHLPLELGRAAHELRSSSPPGSPRPTEPCEVRAELPIRTDQRTSRTSLRNQIRYPQPVDPTHSTFCLVILRPWLAVIRPPPNRLVLVFSRPRERGVADTQRLLLHPHIPVRHPSHLPSSTTGAGGAGNPASQACKGQVPHSVIHFWSAI